MAIFLVASRAVAAPRVLFVSKPVAPPWHDGPTNLVRDVATHLAHARPTVMTTTSPPNLGPRVACEPVFGERARFGPLGAGRVLRRLLRGDPLDLWHFVLAPTPGASTAARLARRTRAALGWRGAVVQTVATAPKSFDQIRQWIFGDAVVVMSEWMRGRLLGAGVSARAMWVIPPCATAPRAIDDDEAARVRQGHDLGDGPIVLYPGDYEISRGAETVARAVPAIARAFPEARVVFACRPTESGAARAAEDVMNDLRELGVLDRTRHLGEVEDMAPLLGIASVVVFPVDEPFGKVDVPLVLLEALAAGVPLVLVRGGALETIDAARFVEAGDADALAREVVDLLADERAAGDLAAAGKELFRARFRPEVVAAAHDGLYAELAAWRAKSSTP